MWPPSEIMSSALLQSAAEYLDRGFSVIPMIDKKPGVPWKNYQANRPTDRHLRRWFDGKRAPTGLAIIFGRVSGNLAQRDFDSLDSYNQWSAEQPSLAATLPTAATRRGRHVYFQADPDELADLRRRIGSTGNGSIKLNDGELRADVGCYSVAPASRHPSGFVYEWVEPLPEVMPSAPLAAFYQPRIDVSPECYTCNVSAAVACAVCENIEGQHKSENGPSELEKAIQQAIDASLPTGPGQRNRKVFLFVQHLKAIPQLAHAEPQSLEPLVRRWHSQALPRITTKGFTETLADFVMAWKRAKFAAGAKLIGPIFQRALLAELPEVARRYDDEPKLQLLISLCRELQRSAGEESFFLSCAKAGELMGLQPMTIWRWIELLKAQNVLELTTKGTTGRKGRASDYRYLGD
jgi:Bifunctional DNA primase/polymerase, N-terminal